MTAKEIAQQAKAAKPHVRYAYSTNDTTVVVWSNNRWVPVAGRILTGGFVALPYELLVNGQPVHANLEYVEC
uniref:Uncharacterized protein n=1 Tax=viral metagenome TaxID=1070528 RepID=A0A6H1ZQC1_9ZZZZ